MANNPASNPAGSADVRRFPCEGCGADLEFHIGTQRLACPHCAFTKELQVAAGAQVSERSLEEALAKLATQRTRAAVVVAPGRREFTCKTCSATIVFEGAITSGECAYCGNAVVDADVHSVTADRLPVDGLLPFQVDKRQAQQALQAWVKSRWFAPNEFKRRGVQGSFNGLYLPYWTFDAMTSSYYEGQRGEHYWVTVGSGDKQRRERRTRWYPASGHLQRFFDDVLVCAKAGLSPRLRALGPWPLEQCLPFNPEVLAGYSAMTYDQELRVGFTECQEQIRAELRSDVQRRIGGDEQRIERIDTQFNALTYKHLLLPVWMLAYAWRNKTHQVIVNACSGEVQGERPYSWIKIALLALTLGVLLAIIIVVVQQNRA
jgi:DNA-directed RNA polymerase subunit RPC12/RpoP